VLEVELEEGIDFSPSSSPSPHAYGQPRIISPTPSRTSLFPLSSPSPTFPEECGEEGYHSQSEDEYEEWDLESGLFSCTPSEFGVRRHPHGVVGIGEEMELGMEFGVIPTKPRPDMNLNLNMNLKKLQHSPYPRPPTPTPISTLNQPLVPLFSASHHHLDSSSPPPYDDHQDDSFSSSSNNSSMLASPSPSPYPTPNWSDLGLSIGIDSGEFTLGLESPQAMGGMKGHYGIGNHRDSDEWLSGVVVDCR